MVGREGVIEGLKIEKTKIVAKLQKVRSTVCNQMSLICDQKGLHETRRFQGLVPMLIAIQPLQYLCS